ncbi:hypothetical protein [Paenibacillus barengoltzii]|uniref:Tyrosine protein kinase n=1 Tax=Paenibacillus barengoltzii J12 TaxID=935846 RepID=A0ABY1M5N3_9BACL|nr:hypothetical protein [Paenibacillus barengoltzii]SMF64410.1 hypothetical protein SAMN02744124_04165 [Paenibacillus barengoltzii J12]
MPHNYDSRQGPVPPFHPYTHFYPGVNPYEIKAEASSLVPYSPPTPTPTQAPTPTPAATTTPKAGGLSLPSLSDLKGIVDRMGGIDGILATMGQVQKVMQTVQQFAPMAKLLTSLLPGGKSRPGSLGRDDYPPRRRKSNRKKSGSRTGSGRSGKRSATGKSGKSVKSGKRRR